MFSMSIPMLIGSSCVALGVVFIACSRYREWLLFMLAGMVFWFGLELLRSLIQILFVMPLLYGYISAFLLFLAGLAVTFAVKDYRAFKKSQRVKPICIEHTPVYEDDQRQYSG